MISSIQKLRKTRKPRKSRKPKAQIPSSPSQYSCSEPEISPQESPPRRELVDLDPFPDPRAGTPPDTPTCEEEPVPTEDVEELPALPPAVAALLPTRVEQPTEERATEKPPATDTEKGPVNEPLLDRLLEASDAFHNLRRRNKEASASKPSVKPFPDRPSLAIQETVIRKENQRHRPGKKSKFSCDLCQVEAINKTVLDEHLEGNKHKSKVARTFENTFCEVCNKDFKHPKCLERHLKGSRHRQNHTFGASEAYKQVVRK